jgi:hypothetical protein
MASPYRLVPELIACVVDNQEFYVTQPEQPAQAVRQAIFEGSPVRNICYTNTVFADNEGDIV